MTTGTKIFLAVFALFVGVMVLYYGVLMPAGAEVVQPEVAIAPDADSPNAAEPQKSRTSTDRNSVPKIEAETQTPTSPALARYSPEGEIEGAMASDPSDSPLEQVGLPIGLDPTRMLPAVNVDELPALEQDQPELRVNPVPSGASNSTAPVVRSNTPVTLVPNSAQPVRTTPADRKPLPKVSSNSPARTSSPPPTTEYLVKSGDTMMTIAKEWLGDENKWSLIAKANPWVDPARMQIGQKLQLPAKDAKLESIKAQAVPEKSPQADKSTYIVRSGDTLAKIAREFYGSIAKWESIYEANKAVIGDDPAALQVGMKLTLPKR